ncbi:primosomal protein N' [Lactobacillus delbrueckii subsp. lactis]|uniref:primosomal protein N' n=1 Tax=Lactobacillus delbrueckii TaxID=1584 RepID=UPI0005554FB0|nr:primosomal protein N' [Lactobacillus delbrueckii]APG68988.1 primosomal protein N' [Lactobacillus delbrueckii subsp. lactis]ASW64199.1 primosomal protein N' [Lactobacillus delbrueckii subsp. lactis]MCD5443442.1 primosomal protein N' [Lactobacillus delbrueckii subsp. lactis]MCD5507819.1 primosomal protein N' [Lactobacillus delbrueckii subsp. lactis]MCD5509636.1 primosomal protein N' [Lactobacillus delbrueckii subsp. lactis]
MIAEVIVDVAAHQTDRVFEYHIPDDLEVEIGSRVVVPFGRRKVQGFVVAVKKSSDFTGQLKDLLLVVDEMPPLTPELVALSSDLARQIFAYRISILKTMLPGVMRANYRKILLPNSPRAEQMPLFAGDPVDLANLEEPRLIKLVKQLLNKGEARIEYLVENKAKKKLVSVYYPLLSAAEYQEIFLETRKTASQQRKLLADLAGDFAAYPKSREELTGLGISSATLKTAVSKKWLQEKDQEKYRRPTKPVAPSRPLDLNDEQAAALSRVSQDIKGRVSQTFLLEGVTGSGKTEVYLQAISQALALGRAALMLVPEISLTPQMVKQVQARFGQQVAVLHSALSEGERYDEWRRIRRGQAQVVVGARSAVFAPLDNLGLIIIDEEHEGSYKQDNNPRYHARDVAIWRSRYHHCPLILGSATPSLASRARAQKGVYQLLRLKKRAKSQPLPGVDLLDLKHVQFAGSQFDISCPLAEAIQKRLEKKEQVILLLNRRGFANFMLCRNCGFVLKCPNCDLSLTMHKDTWTMQCHYCGYQEAVPEICPNCRDRQIRFLGTGTQKVQEELAELFPQAKILRMDVDTTRRKGSYDKILTSFGQGEADILLGTQMIAKGLDFPNVTLVGVINADTGLWLPDYNASERTFELLTQVAGRAGRADKEGQVMIQTYNPDHYAIHLAQKQDYELFYAKEMQVRHAGDYPPYFYTVLVSVSAKNEQNAAREAFKIKRQLQRELRAPTIILGPAPATISRLKSQYYYQILVKYKREKHLNELLHQIQDQAQEVKKYGLTVEIDSEPERIM